MNITVTLDIVEPNFKIGDRVKLDGFHEIETEYWNTPGTVVDVTLWVRWEDQLKLSDPVQHFNTVPITHELWIVHVLFDGAETPGTVHQGNLIHYTGE